MLCDRRPSIQEDRRRAVLILVLMEYALRFVKATENTTSLGVLILVLMEYALRFSHLHRLINAAKVLILVLMEYALRSTANKASAYDAIMVLILVLMEYALRYITGVAKDIRDPS